MKIYRGLPEEYINPNSRRKLLRGNPPMEFLNPKRPTWKKVVFFVGLIGIILIGSCRLVMASAINDKDAILAIIGESENQGWIGMRAVAYAIRNRGTLNGVYGLNATRVKRHKYSLETYRMAERQWKASAVGRDITNGASFWENISAFGKPVWACKMVETFRYKNHVFYKEIM